MTEHIPLNVLVTGGSGPSGVTVAKVLRQAGFRVFTVGSDKARIDAAAAKAGDGVTPLVCDLADLAGVRALRGTLAESAGPIDAVIHLVGGWRGAKGIADQSDADWQFLERGAISAGRFAIVSSTAVEKPTAATASYVAAKAAAEAWTMAMADGLVRSASGEGTDLRGAAVVLVVKALVDAELRKAHPDRTFPGATDVEDLAAAVVGLFSRPVSELNGRHLRLAP